jgi:hypothetical protein
MRRRMRRKRSRKIPQLLWSMMIELCEKNKYMYVRDIEAEEEGETTYKKQL